MNKLLPAALLSIASITGAAQAADLMVDAAPAPMMVDESGPSFYVQGLLGLSLTDELEFIPAPTVSLDVGPVFGGTIGLNTGLGGLALELDAMSSLHDALDGYRFGTLTFMANAKYSFVLTENLDVYAGAGLGAYAITEDYGSGTTYTWGSGYQVMAGVDYDLTDNLSVVGEYRYQNSFDPIDIDGPATLANSAVLAGLKFTF